MVSDLVVGIVSNTLIDGSYVYFASKEELSKIDKLTGQVIWQTPLEKKLTSKSFLFPKGDTLYMINAGYAFRGGKSIKFGKPFIAAFDKQTGK